jgi:pilus assembly protein CpaF
VNRYGRSPTPKVYGPSDDNLVQTLCNRVADLPGDAEELVAEVLGSIAPLMEGQRRERLIRAAVARLIGLDQLDYLMADPKVDEILINRSGQVWVERRGHLTASDPIPTATLMVVLERILSPLGRRLDRSSPIVDARLPDGSRICAVVPPVAVDGTTIAIRRLRRSELGLADFGSPAVCLLLQSLIERRCNIVISGGTSSGKTSLLGVILDQLPPAERVILVEDTSEITVDPTRHLVRLEARAPTTEGPPPITVEDLVRTALRLRPDRIVVGEVRGQEILGLIQALNTGHSGSLATCHANSAAESISRLETLILQASPHWPLAVIRHHLCTSIDILVHLSRRAGSGRQITEIFEIAENSDASPEAEISLRALVADSRVHAQPVRNRT